MTTKTPFDGITATSGRAVADVLRHMSLQPHVRDLMSPLISLALAVHELEERAERLEDSRLLTSNSITAAIGAILDLISEKAHPQTNALDADSVSAVVSRLKDLIIDRA